MTFLVALVVCWLLGALLLALDGRKRWVGWLAAAGLVAAFALNVHNLVQLIAQELAVVKTVTGGWPAGVGIELRADRMSLFFAAICTGVLAAVIFHEVRAGVHSRQFPALILLLAAGLQGAFFTGDLFNFYVFFEVSVVTSFALAAYGFGREEIRATFAYIVLNLLGSVLFLIGVATVYHATGTLDFTDIATSSEERRQAVILPAALLFTALSLKLGLFPFHGWVPLLYTHGRPAVVAALSGALVNIGAYGLLRIGFNALDDARIEGAAVLLLLGAAATLYGAILAVSRRRPATIAAYSAIVHAGHIVLAIGIGGRAGIAAALLTVLAGSIDKTVMFLGFDTLLGRRPAALVAASSVAGLPPTLGFVAKLMLIYAAIQGPVSTLMVAIIIASAVIMLVALFRFWRLTRTSDPQRHYVATAMVPITLAAINVAFALYPQPFIELAWSVAGELLEVAP